MRHYNRFIIVSVLDWHVWVNNYVGFAGTSVRTELIVYSGVNTSFSGIYMSAPVSTCLVVSLFSSKRICSPKSRTVHGLNCRSRISVILNDVKFARLPPPHPQCINWKSTFNFQQVS